MFAVVLALPVALYLPDGGLREFYNTTLGFQLGARRVFSLWGLHPGCPGSRTSSSCGGFALAILVAFFPRGRRTPVQVAALGAAVLIAVQLPAVHWFYFYVAWFMPFVLVALFALYRTGEADAAVDVAPTPRWRSPAPACPSREPLELRASRGWVRGVW